jgi:hypothetical protein
VLTAASPAPAVVRPPETRNETTTREAGDMFAGLDVSPAPPHRRRRRRRRPRGYARPRGRLLRRPRTPRRLSCLRHRKPPSPARRPSPRPSPRRRARASRSAEAA